MVTTRSFEVKGILFDMDGTLIDSTLAVEAAWTTFAITYPHLDIKEILKTSHGVRTEDNLRRFIPEIPDNQIPTESARFEAEIVHAAERRAAHGEGSFLPCPGVLDNILPSLTMKLTSTSEAEPWAVCTSATREYASKALPLAGLPTPKVFVTADDVSNGKPDPDPYLMGAELLGLEPAECLVLEDAPAGVLSGRAAGCIVLAVLTTHSRSSIEATTPDYLVDNLSSVRVSRTALGWRVDFLAT